MSRDEPVMWTLIKLGFHLVWIGFCLWFIWSAYVAGSL